MSQWWRQEEHPVVIAPCAGKNPAEVGRSEPLSQGVNSVKLNSEKFIADTLRQQRESIVFVR